jgi:aminoglycoside phosphotransferase (APT) family kinase protein
MRDQWPRFRPEVNLPPDAVAHLVRLALPDAVVVGYGPVGGGLANTNIRVNLASAPGCVLLRVYQRDPTQAVKESRLDALLQAHAVPTARFHHIISDDRDTGLTCAVMDWVAGVRLDQWRFSEDDLAVGGAVGRVLARVHRVSVGAAGFLSADRRPVAAITLGREALLGYLQLCLIDGPGAGRLGAALTEELFAYVARYAGRLDAWRGPLGLVHGDCNASNFIMDAGQVSALLDWEFAFSGAPAFDFGHLLRPPLGERALFVDGLAQGYQDEGGLLPPDWRWLARLTDLYAWADFLGRPTIAAPLIEDACRMVAETLSIAPP